MAEKKATVCSDDEFEDAVSDLRSAISGSATNETNDQIIEEIIEKHEKLNLEEVAKTENENENDEKQDNDLKEKDNDPENFVMAELLEDVIDEVALKTRDESLSVNELQENKAKADKLKLDGNELFKNGEAMSSIELYTEALKICPTTEPKDRAILYGNRAAAKIKIESKKSAIDDCTSALELWPDYVRALLRRAKLYECDDKLDEALSDYKRVHELDPGQHEAREAMVRLPPIVQERNEKLKEEMLSKLKDLGNMILRPFGLSTSNFQMQQDPNTGGYSINFNQT